MQSGSELIASSVELEPVLHELASSLDFAVVRYARGSLFVLAGVVGWKEHAILIPGSTLSGKTSLVRALVRAGAAYLGECDVAGAYDYPEGCTKGFGGSR